jgi:ADP-ribose pyrophosphatase YjhB (NUDIX family)
MEMPKGFVPDTDRRHGRGLRCAMIRRVLHFYWRFSRGLTIGVRGAAFDQDGRVMLVRHGYVDGWHLPGGGVEPGETLIDALKREMLEEGNVRLTGEPVLHGLFFNNGVSRRDHVALFVIRAFGWDGPPVPSMEIREAGFFAPGRLPEGTTAATRRRLEEIATGTKPAETW